MQTHSIILAAALLAAAFVTPAMAAGPGGGGAPGGVWPTGGGPSSSGPPAGGPPSHGPSSPAPSFRSSNVFAPSGPLAPTSNFKTPHPGWTPVAGVGANQDWRNHRRHHYPGVGPNVAPGGYDDYAYNDYDDGSDTTNCWVYRKAHDRAGRFLGWTHVNVCQVQ
jgi:hypothetical protein